MIKYLITTLIVLVSLSYSYSIFIENNVTETTEIIKRLDGVYVYKTQGVINITNPSLASQVYEYRLTMDAPTGVYGSFTSEDNLTINFNGILGFYLLSNESVSISYKYSGLTMENYITNFSNGQTFIELFSTPTLEFPVGSI